MKENLLSNIDIVVTAIITFIFTAIIVWSYLKYKYTIESTRMITLFRSSFDSIKFNVRLIWDECNSMHSMPRIKGRNDEQKSAVKRIKLYLITIESHINHWDKNGK